MRKSILLITAIVLFVSNYAVAGVGLVVSCTNCGYKSKEVREGGGLKGIEQTVVYCETCKNFFDIPTRVQFDVEANKRESIVASVGKEKYLGEECFVYPCPVCGGRAFAYKGKICPVCKKNNLRFQEAFLWD